MDVTVGVIGSSVGLRGYVNLEVRTDNLRTRFAKGKVLRTEPASMGPLTVQGLRKQGGRIVAAFAEITSREQAERLRGVKLVVDSAEDVEEDAYYPSQLRGLKVIDTEGNALGEVSDLIFGTAHELLEVNHFEVGPVLVPFVEEIVPEIDLEKAVVVLDPPGGLFALASEDVSDEN
ncbi:ribosome maturation factor RimM [Actinomycetaceae bacterium TAE3-ERU4]|nr:ribosome maturation factor RimM [Actinomycetaceae bacterium TAE3-ERU4]